MTLRLHVLGGLAVARDGSSEAVVVQRRRLALLALLAAAGARGVSRDRLVALLWPESPAERARHSLGQLLYGVRRDLGGDDAIDGATELRLNPALLACDLWDFEAALAARDLGRAIAAYGGPFLDGFHLSGASEFERWADETRATLAGRHAAAVESLAEAAAARGDGAAAVEWWRRAAAADPLSARVTMALMRALDAAGDRPAALRQARVHESVVQQELGVDADPAVSALAARLRDAPADAPMTASTLAGAPAERSAEMPAAMTHGRGPDAAMSSPMVVSPAPHSSARRWWPVAVAATVLLAVGAAALVRARGERAAPASIARPASQVVAVLPFTVRGGSDLAYLREGLASLLSATLDGAGPVRTVDPNLVLRLAGNFARDAASGDARAVAQRAGAGSYVVGEVVRAGARLRLSAALYDARAGSAIARASAEGEADSLFRQVDDLAAQLLAGSHSRPAEWIGRLATLTSHSLPAVKRYLAGDELQREGKYAEAADAFEDAVALDSTFALAHLRLSAARGWMSQRDRQVESLARASRHAARLPERARLLIAAIEAADGRDAPRTEQRFREFVERYPGDAEGWRGLGEALFHGNPVRGRSAADARPALERALALAPEQGGEALFHLVTLAASEGRRVALDSLSARSLALQPQGDQAAVVRAQRAAGLGDTAELRRAVEELRQRRGNLVALAMETSAGAGDLRVVESLAASLLDSSRPARDQALGHQLIGEVEVTRGRWSAATAAFARAASLDPALRTRAAEVAAYPFALLPRDAAERLRRELVARAERDTGRTAARTSLAAALLAGRTGDERAALDFAARRAASDPSAAAEVRATIALLRGRAREGIATLDSARVVYAFPRQRWLRAELLFQAERYEDALPWYAASLQGYGALPLLAEVWLRSAQIHERLGHRAEAARDYARYAAARRDCDESSRAALAEATRRLERLR